MRKSLAAILAAITFGGAIAATAAPAEARDHRGDYSRYDGGRGYNGGYGYNGSYGRYNGGYYRYDRHRGNGSDVALAGVVGLALGAALASGNNGYGGSYYSDYPRYRHYRSAVCEDRRWVWDPYIERRVMIRERYRC